jgi:hypothetical protein
MLPRNVGELIPDYTPLHPENSNFIGNVDLREIGWGGMDWIDLAQDRDQWRALLNTVMNFRVP